MRVVVLTVGVCALACGSASAREDMLLRGSQRLAPTRWSAASHGVGEPEAPAVENGDSNPFSREYVPWRVLSWDTAAATLVSTNGGFEEGRAAPLPGWAFWQAGYELSSEGRAGTRCIVCTSDDEGVQHGASQEIVLNQKEPRPIVARGWSKAPNVSGVSNSGYSLYLDIIYTDGTPLWGRTGNFSTGTHDWQMREVRVMPEKPIATVTMHAIFRGHTGTAYFDDFELRELQAPEGGVIYDSVAVSRGQSGSTVLEPTLAIGPDGRWRLSIDPKTGVVATEPGLGGFRLRDVAADSDFVAPLGPAVANGDAIKWRARSESLGLQIEAEYRTVGDSIRVDGQVKDLRGEDRALTLYFALPVGGPDFVWWDDARVSRAVGETGDYRNLAFSGAGATGNHSKYPLGCITSPSEGYAIAVPLDRPALMRIGYQAAAREFYLAYDFGLTQAAAKQPGRAAFSFVLYGGGPGACVFHPKWGFRAALKKYYDLFPDFFARRMDEGGLWMAFTDISTVERPEDFHFKFHEGDNNLPWDDAHGILSFVYTEPQTFWFPLAPEIPRTYEACMQELARLEREGNHVEKRRALATRTSAIFDRDGNSFVTTHDAPWCNGGVFGLNPDPEVPRVLPGAPSGCPGINQYDVDWEQVWSGFERAARGAVPGWNPYGDGAAPDVNMKHGGEQSARCFSAEPGGNAGLSQTVFLNQTEARALYFSGWSRAENATGQADADYSLYLDLAYADGDHLFAQIPPFAVGTHDWEFAEFTVHPAKPVQQATLNALFRRNHAGTVWFDDLRLSAAGSEENLLGNPGLEAADTPPPELDGAYIDSIEGWSDIPNFRREHFAAADVPLTFDTETKRPLILNVFSIYEGVGALADEMHKRGKLIMANAALWRWPWWAHYLDAMGTETNWLVEGEYRPDDHAVFAYRRALSYQKPYLLLQNTDYDRFGPELVERYMQRCLFYGCFPGFFSHDAATDPYFGNPRWYNRDRHLLAKYVPLIQRIHKAGWEPVTHARVLRASPVSAGLAGLGRTSTPRRGGISSRPRTPTRGRDKIASLPPDAGETARRGEPPARPTVGAAFLPRALLRAAPDVALVSFPDQRDHVFVERWGPGRGGDLYFTVFNDSPHAVQAEIPIDFAALGLARPGPAEVSPYACTELVAGRDLPLGRSGSVTVPLDPDSAALLEIRPTTP